MAEGEENPVTIIIDKGVLTIQTLNIISQKVIQVNKPTGYYEDKKKTKTFIY